MTTFRTVTGNLPTITGGDYRNLTALVWHNVLVAPGLVDYDATPDPQTYLPGAQAITVNGSTFAVALIDTDGAGTNVPGGSLRWTIQLNWLDSNGVPQSSSINNFELTADADFGTLVSTADPPAVPANEFLTDAQALFAATVATITGLRDDAENTVATVTSLRDQTQTLRNQAAAFVDQQTALAAIATSDAAVAYLSTFASSTRNAQDARYVRRGAYAIDPRDYGAKGDSTTEDWTAFSNALAAAASFNLPLKVVNTGAAYKVSSQLPLAPNSRIYSDDGATIALPSGGTLFNFDGKTSLHIQGLNITAPDGSAVMLHAQKSSSRITLVRNTCTNARLLITNLGQSYSGIDTSGPGGTPGYVTDLLIDGNLGIHTAGDTVRGTRAFIEMRYARRARVQGNDADAYFHGIMYWGGDSASDSGPRKARDMTIVNNAVRNTFGGIWGSMGQDITAAANNVRDVTDVGIDFEGSSDCVAVGNTVRNATFACYAVFFGCRRITFSGNTAVQESGTGACFKSFSSANPSQWVKVIGNTFISPGRCAFGDTSSLLDSTIENNTMIVTNAGEMSVQYVDCDRLSVSYNRIYHQAAASTSISNEGGSDFECIGNLIRCLSDSTSSVTATTGAIRNVWRSTTYPAQRARITGNKTIGFATGIADVNADPAVGQRESYAVITGNHVPTVAHYQTTNYKGRIANNFTPTDPTVATPETVLT